MKKRTQLILSLAAAGALASTAQAAYVSGDLLVGFSSPGAANDYIFDIGAYSSLTSGETWNLGTFGGSFTSSQFSNGVWGVVGALSLTHSIYSTTGGSAPSTAVGNSSAFNVIKANVSSIGASSVANAAVTPGQTTANSWYTQTAQAAGTPGNDFFNNFENPNVPTSAAASLYVNDDLGDSGTLLGDFSISSTGTLTFTAVPEPGTLSILAGFGLLALKFRRQLARNS